jgi:hypothetical protein
MPRSVVCQLPPGADSRSHITNLPSESPSAQQVEPARPSCQPPRPSLAVPRGIAASSLCFPIPAQIMLCFLIFSRPFLVMRTQSSFNHAGPDVEPIALLLQRPTRKASVGNDPTTVPFGTSAQYRFALIQGWAKASCSLLTRGLNRARAVLTLHRKGRRFCPPYCSGTSSSFASCSLESGAVMYLKETASAISGSMPSMRSGRTLFFG